MLLLTPHAKTQGRPPPPQLSPSAPSGPPLPTNSRLTPYSVHAHSSVASAMRPVPPRGRLYSQAHDASPSHACRPDVGSILAGFACSWCFWGGASAASIPPPPPPSLPPPPAPPCTVEMLKQRPAGDKSWPVACSQATLGDDTQELDLSGAHLSYGDFKEATFIGAGEIKLNGAGLAIRRLY